MLLQEDGLSTRGGIHTKAESMWGGMSHRLQLWVGVDEMTVSSTLTES